MIIFIEKNEAKEVSNKVKIGPRGELYILKCGTLYQVTKVTSYDVMTSWSNISGISRMLKYLTYYVILGVKGQ